MLWFKKKSDTTTEIFMVIFRVSGLLFGVLLVAEVLIPGFVTSWFNPIWVLIIAGISGILAHTRTYD